MPTCSSGLRTNTATTAILTVSSSRCRMTAQQGRGRVGLRSPAGAGQWQGTTPACPASRSASWAEGAGPRDVWVVPACGGRETSGESRRLLALWVHAWGASLRVGILNAGPESQRLRSVTRGRKNCRQRNALIRSSTLYIIW